MFMFRITKGLFIICMLIMVNACKKNDTLPTPTEDQTQFGIFKAINDSTAEMGGVISGKTPAYFDQLIEVYPNLKTINMLVCEGSEDDEANLIVSKKMHNAGLSFHLFSNSLIASGAVDMYVAGKRRTREQGSQIGVHSWRDSDPSDPIATSYPVGHAVHLPYINYYVSVGFTQQEAEDFYYFTIHAAKAEDIHWMTEEEIILYKITK
jgi:hypothetical protein